MKLKIIKSEGIAHSSYFLFDGEEAVVVDPRRDCQIYPRLAEKECAKSGTYLKLTETKTTS